MDRFDLRNWKGYQGPPLLIDHIATHSAYVSPGSSLFVALPGQHRDGHTFVPEAARQGATCALVRQDYPPSPLPLTLLRVPDPLLALQQIATAYRNAQRAQIVALTGSYGKTITKEILAHLLAHKRCRASRESFNSQLGVALSLLDIRSSDAIALIEAGISRPGEMEKLITMIAPDAALLTALGDAHITTLGDRETIIREKGKLLQAVPSNGWVLAPENLWNLPHWMPSYAPHAHLPTVVPHPPSRFAFHITFPGGTQCVVKLCAGFPELHAVVTQVVRAAWLLGLAPQEIKERLDGYRPELMRTEVWTSVRGVQFVNDCSGLDPLSLDRSLRMLPEARESIFVMEGSVREAALHRLATRGPVLHVGSLTGPNITPFPTRREALRHLYYTQRQGQVVLIKGENRQSIDALRNDLADGIGETRLEVSMDAIRHNVTTLSQRHNTAVIPMIKADGYGIGALPLARFLPKCGSTLLGTAHVSEAVQLRLAGINTPLFALHAGLHEASQVVEWNLETGVSDAEMIARLSQEAAQKGKKINLHLHLNTGMTRFGCEPHEFVPLARAIEASPCLTLRGVFTHLACAHNPQQDGITHEQIAAFQRACAALDSPPPLQHIANSAGLLRFGSSGGNAVRIGRALFGFAEDKQLRPALNLTSRIATIHPCKRGDTVGYGASYRICDNTAQIGVIPMGYFDGLRRSFGAGGTVLVHGRPVPIVGDICMDFCMVDLTTLPDAAVGDPVLFFGQDDTGATLPASTCAAAADLSFYELITGLGPRVQRLYIYDGEARDLL